MQNGFTDILDLFRETNCNTLDAESEITKGRAVK